MAARALAGRKERSVRGLGRLNLIHIYIYMRVVQNPPCLRVILGRPSDDGNEGPRKSAMGRERQITFSRSFVLVLLAQQLIRVQNRYLIGCEIGSAKVRDGPAKHKELLAKNGRFAMKQFRTTVIYIYIYIIIVILSIIIILVFSFFCWGGGGQRGLAAFGV